MTRPCFLARGATTGKRQDLRHFPASTTQFTKLTNADHSLATRGAILPSLYTPNPSMNPECLAATGRVKSRNIAIALKTPSEESMVNNARLAAVTAGSKPAGREREKRASRPLSRELRNLFSWRQTNDYSCNVPETIVPVSVSTAMISLSAFTTTKARLMAGRPLGVICAVPVQSELI